MLHVHLTPFFIIRRVYRKGNEVVYKFILCVFYSLVIVALEYTCTLPSLSQIFISRVLAMQDLSFLSITTSLPELHFLYLNTRIAYYQYLKCLSHGSLFLFYMIIL